MTDLRQSRKGLTVVELLVAFAIVGTLVAMLLPAVSAAREAARQMRCSNHLRQIGIGLHTYHNAHSTFPPGHVADREIERDGRSWGWAALLLPFVEQAPLSQRLDTRRRSFDEIASNATLSRLLATEVPLYRCPSDEGDGLSHPYRSISVSSEVTDRSNNRVESGLLVAHIFPPPAPDVIPLTTRIAKSNYIGSIGSRWKSRRTDWESRDFRGNGLFGRNSDVTIASIFDGTSQTIAAGERCMRNYAAVWAGGNSWAGCGFTDNQMVLGTAYYPINDAPIRANIDCDGRGSANFSSNHPDGANFLFADGSVRFLSQQIDLIVFRNLADRSDGVRVGDF
ncbi:MAG: DUF1559 domain-containing protein [Planctomycetota bacterium]